MACSCCGDIRSDLKSAVATADLPRAAKAVSEGTKLAAQQALAALKRKAPAITRRR